MKMRFHQVLLLTGCSAWICAATAAPDTPQVDVLKPAKSIPELVQELSDPKFRVREEATRKLWAAGDSAVPELEKTAAGKDPESAYRSREVLHKIRLFVTPDTDPEIIAMVERYEQANTNEKLDLFTNLQKKRAWRQVLKIYASETDTQVQAHFQSSINEVAVIAARECLMKGDVEGARNFLEMAPANSAGLLALADFHRSQGTLNQELLRAKGLQGQRGAEWRLALQRAAGDLAGARESAILAGEDGLASSMSALLGDPLPFLRYQMGSSGSRGGSRFYTPLAIKRWEKTIRPSDIAPLVRESRSTNPTERIAAIGALFLLGEFAKAEAAYSVNSRLEAFAYLESMERIPEALKALGLDPEQPDYRAWVLKRFEGPEVRIEEEDQETSMSGHSQELAILANFLERRGLDEINFGAFSGPLHDLATKDENGFTGFIGVLFGHGDKTGSPRLATRLAIEWAGEDDRRWDDVISATFAGQDETIALWDWLAELDPKATRAERLDGLLAICSIGTDPKELAGKWRELAWAEIEATPPEDQRPLLDRMLYLANLTGEASGSLRVWDKLPEKAREDIYWNSHVLNLTSAGRWADAADFYMKQLRIMAERGLDPQPAIHAYAASTLRKAGRVTEARTQDDLVEKLALGRNAAMIANGYDLGCDYGRAALWRARAACQTDPNSEDFNDVFMTHSRSLVEQGSWKEASAVSEVVARAYAPIHFVSGSPLAGRQVRFQSDFCRAMANLKTDRSGSIAALAACHRDYPTDGGLADHFFPAVRAAGLVREHDEWFKKSWDDLMAVVSKYPDCDNLANTAGWLAARAHRNLPEAEKLLKHALSISPGQSAYLDTMAEIQFALGRREKALEWSTKAVDQEPLDPMLRRQRERFRTDPLPR